MFLFTCVDTDLYKRALICFVKMSKNTIWIYLVIFTSLFGNSCCSSDAKINLPIGTPETGTGSNPNNPTNPVQVPRPPIQRACSVRIYKKILFKGQHFIKTELYILKRIFTYMDMELAITLELLLFIPCLNHRQTKGPMDGRERWLQENSSNVRRLS